MVVKALFFAIYPDTPHFETELELIADLLQQGHEVRVVRCTGQLVSCLRNPEHREAVCVRCRSKIEQGLARLAHHRLSIEVMAPPEPPAELWRRFSSMDELKTFMFAGANIGRGACASSCVLTNKDTQLDPRVHASTVTAQLVSAYQMYEVARSAIARSRPECAYVFNGRFATCYPVILAARDAGIDFYTHERGATIDHYMLRRNALPHDLGVAHDEINALWEAAGTDREERARAWYGGRRDGAETAWESFTKAQHTGALPAGFDPGVRNIAIFNSTMEEYDTIVQDPSIYPDEVAGMRCIAESLGNRRDLRLWLRVHPNLKNIPRVQNYQLRAYQELARTVPNLTVIWPESPVHTYALMEHADVVLTFGSTMGAESAFWGKPSVLAGRSFYERLGCCYAPRDHDELISLLVSPLTPQRGDGVLRYGYWESVKGTLYRRFRATGLYTGRFEGEEVSPTLLARSVATALRIIGR